MAPVNVLVASFLFIRKDGQGNVVRREEFDIITSDVVTFFVKKAKEPLSPDDSPKKETQVIMKPMEDGWRVFVGEVFLLDTETLQKIADSVSATRFSADYSEVREDLSDDSIVVVPKSGHSKQR